MFSYGDNKIFELSRASYMHLRFLSAESIIIYKLVLSSVWLPSHSVRVMFRREHFFEYFFEGT